MYKKFNTRTRALISACVPNSPQDHDEDENNSSVDVIENSPQNSPTTKEKRALPLANDSKFIELEDQPHNISGEMLISDMGQPISEIQYLNSSQEIVEEKSIEPPPYSPLTPRPLIDLNARVSKIESMNNSGFRNDCMKSPEPCDVPHEAFADQSIEPSLPSPLSTDLLSSPLQPMTPETTQIYNILTDTFANDNFNSNTVNINENPPTTSSADSNRNVDISSSEEDDSVQDPDFICINDNNASDTSSTASESLITRLTEVYDVSADPNELQPVAHSSQTPSDNSSESSTMSCGRPIKGRKRKYEYTRVERKKRKYQNLSYIGYKKQTIFPKQFSDYNCQCPKKCIQKISCENRLKEFQKFYALGSYEAQNMFIAACVIEKPVNRSYVSVSVGNLKKKTFTREYKLNNVPVCKKMFINTLKTSSKRINTSLTKKRDNCILDKRGNTGGQNKTSPENEAFIVNLIQALPTYISHYRRATSNEAKFLRHDMTFSKIYELYCDEAKAAQKEILSFSKVKHVFLTKFNLRTKSLKKDTCNKCDYYASKKTQGSEEQKALMEDAHREHLHKAKVLQKQLKSDMQLAKEDPFTETITFDLQKTLPLPRIPTNLVFYKRQLWVYNLGIHSGTTDQAHCNIWVEGEAGRGSQEVGSCLIKHVSERLSDNVKYLILWSDSCGGQNRNIKLTLMLKALLEDHSTLETIRLCFLESGHSFLPNDTDFGRIECALKLQQRLYTPDDYMRIMRTFKKTNPMQVHRMNKEDFFSSANLEKKITNRKKTTDGLKVSWLNTKEILLKKEATYSIFMRSNLEEDYIEVNIKKNLRINTGSLTKDLMDPLWPNGKSIPEAKLKDLKSLLHLIPEEDQGFYTQLTGNVNIEDDIDGYSGEVDFEIEMDNVD